MFYFNAYIIYYFYLLLVGISSLLSPVFLHPTFSSLCSLSLFFLSLFLYFTLLFFWLPLCSPSGFSLSLYLTPAPSPAAYSTSTPHFVSLCIFQFPCASDTFVNFSTKRDSSPNSRIMKLLAASLK